jgi:hypothetical protein
MATAAGTSSAIAPLVVTPVIRSGRLRGPRRPWRGPGGRTRSSTGGRTVRARRPPVARRPVDRDVDHAGRQPRHPAWQPTRPPTSSRSTIGAQSAAQIAIGSLPSVDEHVADADDRSEVTVGSPTLDPVRPCTWSSIDPGRPVTEALASATARRRRAAGGRRRRNGPCTPRGRHRRPRAPKQLQHPIGRSRSYFRNDGTSKSSSPSSVERILGVVVGRRTAR